MRDHLDGVAHADSASPDDPRGDAAVAPHGIVTAGSEILFHAGTGVAATGLLQHHRTDVKAPVGEAMTMFRCGRWVEVFLPTCRGEQIDAGDDDVAPHGVGR